MIYLNLFWTFFKIGLFTIGGGQAMIPMIMKEVVAKNWLTENELLDFIAISESTPGAFAINISTYAGIEVAGIWGSVCATLGIILPSIIIISLISILFSNYMKKKAVNDVFNYVRSVVTGLLLAVFISLLLSVIFNITNIYDISAASVDYIGLGLFIVFMGLSFIKIKKKKFPPILLILASAVVGLICYQFIPL